MTSFYKKQKKIIISALILIGITALSLWVKSYFSKKADAKQQTTINSSSQNHIADNRNGDSAKQTINQVTQMNSNKGDVNNEFVSGDKKVYNYNQTTNEVVKEFLNNKDLIYFKNRIPNKSCGIWMFTFNQDIKSQEYANKLKNSMIASGYKNVHVPLMILKEIKPEQLNKIDFEMVKDSQNVNIQIYPIR